MVDPTHPLFPIVREVAALYALTPDELWSKSRMRNTSEARALAYLVIRTKFRWSYPELGKFFGFDHSSVMTGVEKATRRVNSDPRLCENFQRLVAT